jgi:hypothetical protein
LVRFAPIIAVQASGAVPSERSFVGGAANGWDWWFRDDPLSGGAHRKQAFVSRRKSAEGGRYIFTTPK